MNNPNQHRPPQDIPALLERIKRPKKAVITAGMPYANGPLHIGHLAGAHVPADIYARWMRMLIGGDNVLFVCGTDDHGSTSEVAAKTQGKTTREFIDEIHAKQSKTMDKYSISLDVYTGTSREENFEAHKNYCQDFLRKLYDHKMLTKKSSEQWFDPKMNLFLPDRYVYGTCPNPECDNKKAYSDECDVCNTNYEPKELKDPKSAISDATPVLKETEHWWLDMWKVSDPLKKWIESKQKTWRKSIISEVLTTVSPSIIFANTNEEKFKTLKEKLPAHKSRYAPGKKIVVQFESLSDLDQGQKLLADNGVESQLLDAWAHRSITRDVAWGIPVPTDRDTGMEGKTLYVWPESLIAPISFSQVALKKKGLDPATYKDYWHDPEANVYQFLGQDNVYFYVLMQGAMWLGIKDDQQTLPQKGDLQMTDILSCYHLQIDGQKMSKSKGNFYTADQLVDEMNYTPDQVRYFLALLSLTEKPSNFDFETFKQRNDFLAGPLNASFEKPISATHSKFNGVVPQGKLMEKVEKETFKIVQTYLRSMEKAEYSKLLFMIENYARTINGLFTQFKPHDDRHDLQERSDALYSCFYILKNVMIMLHPFVPQTMERLRLSLNLPETVFSVDELNVPFPQNHSIGEQSQYF
ncbi:MAG: methionine--tRNA ligase [Bdellovibrio sp. CG12_big_fil_rev_8_21_14_0_65_39_13]|nr:MAG: methionine--tRNA ligase [Bdellovibrio sp. CG22_combo_CG10-13_8_21_14_all_39_27]PIQ60113.1 MAG: methionine--tRNA ligase [Bdellovibrio sp. CG12_big_fil_rev_8_21_14_0_65_39_13]PIR36749.1 MAG: methionine--tRNA ligase [Bdellovibrio sp. CG11_big_fil_rev_8_21_14_0_20_39_38]